MSKSPHIPVLYREVIDAFADIKEGIIVDCTMGYAGHSSMLLEANPDIQLIGIDQDQTAIDFSTRRLEVFGDRVQIKKGRFSNVIKTILEENKESKEILTALIETYKNMGDKDSAIKTAETLISLQGDADGSEALDQMGTTFNVYDEMLDEYAEEYENLWNRNLEAFILQTSEPMEEEGGKEEESIIVESIPEFDNEIVPIIDIGGIEPIIEVN